MNENDVGKTPLAGLSKDGEPTKPQASWFFERWMRFKLVIGLAEIVVFEKFIPSEYNRCNVRCLVDIRDIKKMRDMEARGENPGSHIHRGLILDSWWGSEGPSR